MKRKKLSVLIVVLVCLVSTAAGVSAIWHFTKEDKLVSEAKLLIGKEINFQDFEKNLFQDNQALPDNKQKVWLIYLVSTCEACKDELQFAGQLAENPDSQIEIFGVMAEEESVIREFVEQHNIKFPVLIDKGRNFARSIKLKYFPSNFILNDGKIEKVLFGSPRDKTKLSEFVK